VRIAAWSCTFGSPPVGATITLTPRPRPGQGRPRC
jgi:hypothetical protein